MREINPGEGHKFFPSFFIVSLLLTLALGFGFFPLKATAQKTERDGLSRFDRLAEEATLLNKRKQYDHVISLLEPHQKDKKNDSALFFNELGIAYRNKEKFAEAIQAYREALTRDPENPVITNNLGHVHHLKKEYPQAIEQYEKAIQVAPRFKEVHANLALTLYELKKYKEALVEIEIVLKLDPNHGRAKKLREDILRKKSSQK
jgi:tetratricopeptide (TPR) repeat protein